MVRLHQTHHANAASVSTAALALTLQKVCKKSTLFGFSGDSKFEKWNFAAVPMMILLVPLFYVLYLTLGNKTTQNRAS